MGLTKLDNARNISYSWKQNRHGKSAQYLVWGSKMNSDRQHLLDMILDPDDAYGRHPREIEPMQISAVNDVFQQRRKQIPLVGRRAEDAGITEVRSLADLVPLLFAHTTYKSYPISFVEQARWDRMLQWLNTLSVADTIKVDVSGVKNIDEWLERLWAEGHMVLSTSGSSGKCSFLNHTRGDSDLKKRHFKYSVGWPFVRSSPDRPVFWLGPLEGPNSNVEAGKFTVENWGRPGKIYALTDQPLRMSEVSKMAAMRKRLADGTATPNEIAEFEEESRVKGAAGMDSMRRLADAVIDHRHEPIYVTGQWGQAMMIVERGRDRGIPDGEFHPKSIVSPGGGIKGIKLPPDYKEQIAAFFGDVLRPGSYGMTEMAQVHPTCEANRYHRPPGLIWLILDKSGERLVTPADGRDGVVEGRFAFFDLVYEGRWGGTITGDKVTVDFSDRCPCGRPGPTLVDNITRYATVGEDDHIGCAGTIDGYIRGALAV